MISYIKAEWAAMGAVIDIDTEHEREVIEL